MREARHASEDALSLIALARREWREGAWVAKA
jgi:hypothetical protein